MHRIQNVNLVPNPTILSPDLPKQGKIENFDSWERRASFHQAIIALPKDVVIDLGDEFTQNEYINKLRNGKAIKKIAIREWASPSQADQENYSEVTFIVHLRALHDQYEAPSFFSRSDSFSRRPSSSARHTSRLNVLEEAVSYNNVILVHDNNFFHKPDSLLDYDLNGVDIDQHVKERPEAVHGLISLIHAISNSVCSNDIRLFDIATQRCTVCN